MNKSIQKQFLDIILDKYPKKSEAVDALASKLGLGKDAIYRRMRGDTLLTPDEMKELAIQFKISMDNLIYGNTDTFFFSYNAWSDQIKDYNNYVSNLQADLVQVSKLPDATFRYASSEIPFFFYCFIPELIKFKLYIFARTIWDVEYLQDKPFDFDLIPVTTVQMTNELIKEYIKIPSTDLWSQNIMDNTLSQIEYHVTSGGFKNEADAVLLCEKLQELNIHMRSMAKYGKKFLLGSNPESSGAAFDLYHNEMVYTNNTILVNSAMGDMVYTTFCSPNFLKSTDKKICQHSNNWYNKLLSKSHSISQHAERGRNTYFNILNRKIESTRKRIAYAIGLEES